MPTDRGELPAVRLLTFSPVFVSNLGGIEAMMRPASRLSAYLEGVFAGNSVVCPLRLCVMAEPIFPF
jgi:hypothetical protein